MRLKTYIQLTNLIKKVVKFIVILMKPTKKLQGDILGEAWVYHHNQMAQKILFKEVYCVWHVGPSCWN